MRLWPLLILLAAPAEAGLSMKQNKQNAGLPGEWLSGFTSNAREAGLANASVALGGSGSAYANPAGLAEGRLGEANFLMAPLLAGSQYHAVSFIHPLALRRYLGLTLLNLSSGEAERTDSLGQSRGSFKSQQSAFLISWGNRMTESLDVGINFKWLKQSIAEYSSSAYGVDLGLQTGTWGQGFGFGISASNVLAPQIKLKEKKESYPLILRAGPSLRAGYLLLSADASYWDPSGAKVTRFALGAEINPFAGRFPFLLRAGVNGREIAMGFGVANGPLTFDYAASFHELELNHRIGLTLRYGYLSGNAQTKIDSEWERLKNKEDELRAGRITQKKFEQALAAAPSPAASTPAYELRLGEARQLLKAGSLDRCRRLIEELERERPGDGRLLELKRDLYKRSAEADARSEMQSAQVYYNSAEYSRALQAALKALKILVQSNEAESLISMSKAQLFILDGNYIEAQKELQRVVEMNPDHEEAVFLFRKINNVLDVIGGD